jgi:hypothetical protein
MDFDNGFFGGKDRIVYPSSQPRSKESDDSPFTLFDKTLEVADKLVELKKLLCKYLSMHEVQPIILDCFDQFRASGSLLLEFLAAAGRCVRFRDSLDQLTCGTANKKYHYPPSQVPNIDPVHASINSQFMESSSRSIVDSTEIFGFRTFACHKCLTRGTRYVSFVPAPLQTGRRERAHVCNPVRIASAVFDQGRSSTFLLHGITQLLKENVNTWTGNMNYLVARRLQSRVQENISLFNCATSGNIMITFQNSKERHRDIFLNEQNVKDYQYILTAVEDGKTQLTDKELTNFLEMMKDATFGTITVYYKTQNKIGTKETEIPASEYPSYSYFVYITKYSTLDNIWQAWQSDPSADFIASIFPALSCPIPFSSHAQSSPPSPPRRYRAVDLSAVQENRITTRPTSPTPRQQSGTTRAPPNTNNQEYSGDPYYAYWDEWIEAGRPGLIDSLKKDPFLGPFFF